MVFKYYFNLYDCDYLWWNASAVRFALVGAGCADGSRCGFATLTLYDTASRTSWSIGASLTDLPVRGVAGGKPHPRQTHLEEVYFMIVIVFIGALLVFCTPLLVAIVLVALIGVHLHSI